MTSMVGERDAALERAALMEAALIEATLPKRKKIRRFFSKLFRRGEFKKGVVKPVSALERAQKLVEKEKQKEKV